MVRVLVTAATKDGATTEIAQAIAETLGEHGVRRPWLKPARELVERHAATLAGRCGCSPAGRSATHPSRKRTRWMWPSSRI